VYLKRARFEDKTRIHNVRLTEMENSIRSTDDNCAVTTPEHARKVYERRIRRGGDVDVTSPRPLITTTRLCTRATGATFLFLRF